MALAPALPGFAVMEDFPVYCRHTDAIRGTGYRIVGTAYTAGWAKVLLSRHCAAIAGELECGDLGVRVHEWRDGRWQWSLEALDAIPALDDADIPF